MAPPTGPDPATDVDVEPRADPEPGIGAGPDVDQTALVVAFERIFEVLRRSTAAEGLSLTAASTLGRLERTGPHRLCELAAAEGVTQPAMTQLVTRLERDGLARRGSDPTDGRVVTVTVTDAGRQVVHRRRAVRAGRLLDLIDQMAPADRAAIAAAAGALHRLCDPAHPPQRTVEAPQRP